MSKERTITLADREYTLNYGFFEIWFAEKELGKGLQLAMLDGTIDSTVAILWAGVHREACTRKIDRKRHTGCEFAMEDMFDLLQAHHKAGGAYDVAVRQAIRAMYENGILGNSLDEKTLTRIFGSEETGEGKARTVVAAE